MKDRISCVNELYVNTLLLSSTISIGDTYVINPTSEILAVQRELPIFYQNEGNFDSYPIFSEEIPQLTVYEPVDMSVINKSHYIDVNSIDVISTSTSAIIQIGTANWIDNETRAKHFRQLLYE